MALLLLKGREQPGGQTLVLEGQVDELLALSTFRPSAQASMDFVSRNADSRLVTLLSVLARQHISEVQTIETGYPLGPVTPGGLVNGHFYARAAVVGVDGVSITATRRAWHW